MKQIVFVSLFILSAITTHGQCGAGEEYSRGVYAVADRQSGASIKYFIVYAIGSKTTHDILIYDRVGGVVWFDAVSDIIKPTNNNRLYQFNAVDNDGKYCKATVHVSILDNGFMFGCNLLIKYPDGQEINLIGNNLIG